MDKFRDRLKSSGQALVEYALIVILVGIALIAALAITAPAIGNVFSNTIYNLLGATTTPRSLPDAAAFWATVTWAAQRTPVDIADPLNTLAPATNTPTNLPPGTPPTVAPSWTPAPSNTPPPTNTPTDTVHPYPWTDTVDRPQDWRVDNLLFLGSEDWYGTYYANTNFGGTAFRSMNNAALNPPSPWGISFDWGNSTPFPGELPNDGWSAYWTRRIYVPTSMALTFTVTSDDGARLWIDYTSGCAGGVAPGSGDSGENTSTSSCLAIDNWQSQSPQTMSVTRTLSAGYHNLRLDYFDSGGGAQAALDIRQNPAALTNANDTGSCNWGRRLGTQSNSYRYMWEEWLRGDVPGGSRCTLELRGGVTIPAGANNATLEFWHVWDLAAGTNVSLQIGEYNAATRTPPATWQTIALPVSGSANYNWTRFAIPLNNVSGTNYLGKTVSIRFVIQNSGGATAQRWYIDDLYIGDRTSRTFTIGQFWNLNDSAQKSDFITTGRWDLTTQNARGGTGSAWTESADVNIDGGRTVAWNEESPIYSGESQAYSAGSGNTNEYRIHYLELNGTVNLSGNLPDAEGDLGDPQLSFYYAYAFASRMWFEVQYSNSTSGGWRTVPEITGAAVSCWQASDNPGITNGCILPYRNASRSNGLTFQEVVLKGIPNWNTEPFRLRFAVIVPGDMWYGDGGIWIDDIYIERVSRPRYHPYPFLDDAELSEANWRMSGNWARFATTGVFNSGNVYTDSPTQDYQGDTMMTSLPAFDFRSDTQNNPASPACNILPATECTSVPDNPAAVRPMMEFWHYRQLGSNTTFAVEWKRMSEPDTAFRRVWSYAYLNTVNNGNGGSVTSTGRTGSQQAWERVEIDLQPILQQADASGSDRTDDDIIFRFRLTATGSATGGVFIDNIRVYEYSEQTFALWDGNATFDPDGAGPSGNITVAGNGEAYVDGFDVPSDWWNRWHDGGNWDEETFDVPPTGGGLRAFHESVGPTASPQTAAPYYTRTNSGTSSYDGIAYPDNTFNVLEMKTIIDLRGVASTDIPTLEFWHRYYLGDNDIIAVQIQVEDRNNAGTGTWPLNATSPCGDATNLRQCYERTAGWRRWETPWCLADGTPANTSLYVGCLNSERNYGWTRVWVPLTSYVGQRIRVRFVVDGLDNGSNRDGWYVDSIRFFYNIPRVYNVPFYDDASNMSRWVGEGIWGLDPERFRGAGGGPADLGPDPWRGYWYACDNCDTGRATSLLNAIPRTNEANGTAVAASQPPNLATLYPVNPTNSAPPDNRFYAFPRFPPQSLLEINFDFGSNGPRYSNGTLWRDNNFAARFLRNIQVQSGDYTWIATSDDGIRIRSDGLPATNAPPNDSGGVSGACNGWNIICNWNDHGRTVNMNTVNYTTAGTYLATVEYYERTGDAVVIVTAGTNNFSFSDSPKAGVGPSFPTVYQEGYYNTSLMLDGVMDFCGLVDPQAEFWTYFDSNAEMGFEISTNGGLDWNPDGPHSDSMGFNDDWGNGTSSDWQVRRYYLAAYRNQYVTMRFRLPTGTSLRDGFWITDILIERAAVAYTRQPSGLCIPASPVGELIQLPGFELGGSDGNVWNLSNGAQIVNTPVRSGGYSLRVGTGTNSEAYQSINGLTPNTSYTLRAWVRTTSTNDGVEIGVRGHLNGNTGDVTTSSTSTTWVQISRTFTTGTTETSAEIYCEKQLSPATNPGYGYCDDFTLTSP